MPGRSSSGGRAADRFSDPGGGRYQARSARKAIEGFLDARAGDLKVDRLDVREESAAEGVNTLRIRYTQYVNDLPVIGAGIHASADIARASVTRVENTVDNDLSAAPDPAAAKGLDAVTPAALKPFATGYASARIVSSTVCYLRDRERPTVPDEDYPTASVELLRTGVRPDGKLHLVHDIRVETSEPFEQFRVVVDAISGRVRFVELVGKYVAATGQVFLPDPVSESNSATLSSTSTAATLNPFRHTVTMEINPASGGFFRLEGDWIRCVDWDTPTFAVPGGDHRKLLLPDPPLGPPLPQRQHLSLAGQLRPLPADVRESDAQRRHGPGRRRRAGLRRRRQQ